MAKLQLQISSASYTFAEPSQLLSQPLPGGLSKTRLDIVGGMSRLINITYECNGSEYKYLVNFIRRNIAFDYEPIQLDLIISQGILQEYNATIVPDTFKLDAVDGVSFTCSFQVHAIPLDTEPNTWPGAWTDFVLQLAPQKESYSVHFGNEGVTSQLDGPLPRTRRSYFNAGRTVQVQWKCRIAEYDLLMQAYLAWVKSGGKPFLIDLFMDHPALTRHKAIFIPGSFTLTNHQGDLLVVSAELEVAPTPWPVSGVAGGGGGPSGSWDDHYEDPVPTGTGEAIGWANPVTGSTSIAHANSGTGFASDFTPSGVTTLYAGVVGYTGQIVTWSIASWTSALGDASPSITDEGDGIVRVSWPNADGDIVAPPPVFDPSVGTLILTATIDGTPVPVGERLVVTVTPIVLDYAPIAWGPE